VLNARGVRFLFGDRAVALAGDGPVTVVLSNGNTIATDAAAVATNVPGPIEGWSGIYTKISPYRTYMVAMEVSPGAVIDALFWDMQTPYHYARLQWAGGRELLLLGGSDHKAGQPPEEGEASCFGRVESWAREHFRSAGPVVSRWSGQVSESVDGAAFIGRVPTGGHRACFVITGDSGMGLTHGTLGAMLVSDLVLRRANPWTGDYACDRRKGRALGEFLKENLNAALELRDHVTPGDVSNPEQIPLGQGAVVRTGLTQLAVFRDTDGVVHKRSAVCPHLGCVVHWNNAESSWDCPCHGSRFNAKGGVIIGPSTKDLSDA
jgi:nitrite reductase/ring-hydroxylating ferredoxin subunit